MSQAPKYETVFYYRVPNSDKMFFARLDELPPEVNILCKMCRTLKTSSWEILAVEILGTLCDLDKQRIFSSEDLSNVELNEVSGISLDEFDGPTLAIQRAFANALSLDYSEELED